MGRLSAFDEFHADAGQLDAVVVAQHDGAVVQRDAIDGGHVSAFQQRQLKSLVFAPDGGNGYAGLANGGGFFEQQQLAPFGRAVVPFLTLLAITGLGMLL